MRTDGLGSWIDSLNFLTWLGSIVTAAIVHLFHDVTKLSDSKTWWTLPVTIFVAEHIYLSTRYLVRLGMEQLGSAELRQKKLHEYAQRKQAFQEYMGGGAAGDSAGKASVDEIKEESSHAAAKSEGRRKDIEAMIDFVKGSVKESSSSKED